MSLGMQILTMILMFATRTIFIKFLEVEYLGINGLFSNILTLLSLSELGIGSTITITLYKPLASKDFEQVARVMNLFSVAYRCIGIVILCLGVILLPFLDILVKTDEPIPYLNLIYFLFVFNTSVSYFFSYKRILLTADQKEYISSLNVASFKILSYIFQIIVLFLTHSFIGYLLCDIFFIFLSNLQIHYYVNKKYSYLVSFKNSFLSKPEKISIFKGVGAMMSHKVGNIVMLNVPGILISSILGTAILGIYSNYQMILNVISNFARLFFAAPSASIGNYIVSKPIDDIIALHKKITYLTIFIYGFIATEFICLINPFIFIWIGKDYLLNETVVIIMAINLLLNGILVSNNTFVMNCGIYKQTKLKPWLLLLVSTTLSIIGAYIYGLEGLLLGSVFSYISIGLWYDPCKLYRLVFFRPIRFYLTFFLNLLFILLLTSCLVIFLTSFFEYFILKILISSFSFVLFFTAITYRKDECKYLLSLISYISKHR